MYKKLTGLKEKEKRGNCQREKVSAKEVLTHNKRAAKKKKRKCLFGKLRTGSLHLCD